MRIVSLLAGATEILYGLGLGDSVVGISHECDTPPEALHKPRVTVAYLDSSCDSSAIDEHVRSRSMAGVPLYEIDLPLLASLRPGLIVTQSQCDVCAVSYDVVMEAVATRRELADTQVVAMNPTNLPTLYEDILRIGVAADVSAAAREFVGRLKERESVVSAAAARILPVDRPRVICIEWIEPLMIAANWIPELIEKAGGTSGLTRAGERSAYADWKAVVGYDPEVILVSPCGFDLPRTLREVGRLKLLPGWERLSAVRNHRVFAVDGNAYFNRSSPRILDSLELLAALIHPSYFTMPPNIEGNCWARL